MDFNRYFNNEEFETILKEWCQTYPRLVSLSLIG